MQFPYLNHKEAPPQPGPLPVSHIAAEKLRPGNRIVDMRGHTHEVQSATVSTVAGVKVVDVALSGAASSVYVAAFSVVRVVLPQ